jgi:hypothetical protein
VLVHAYLADVLVRVDDHPQKRIDELLPDCWAAACFLVKRR